ncbi:hypothetical protein pEaSNUABM44_00490 [Erwinia phage pEa_SNUABM_44]|nr:hypothetical protein pEaSNUABM44_00490 [Erwinia phage pEa_SNUABM_44]
MKLNRQMILSTDSVTDVKVTKIKNKYHARLFVNGILSDEMACSLRSDIGWICREMMRWCDKLGAGNAHTTSARRRHNEDASPRGKVYYYNEIQNNIQKHKAKNNGKLSS